MVTMVMMSVGVAELKAHLSEHLARVRAGSEVLVTERGRPVARIVPVGSGELDDLERQGVVRAGSMRLPPGFLDEQRPEVAGPGVTDALLEERSTGR